jgi:hypothetical protein
VYDDTESERITELQGECMLTAEEPRNMDEAVEDVAWRAAMDEEMASINENKTWELTTLPRGDKAIGLKWVFKVKRDAAGNLVKHKARLVAKGYAQRQGVDGNGATPARAGSSLQLGSAPYGRKICVLEW